MDEQVPGLTLDLGSTTGPSPSVEAGGHAEPVWTSLREIGWWGVLRMLPGAFRTAWSKSDATPGGLPVREPGQPERVRDQLLDVGLDSAAIDDGQVMVGDFRAAEASSGDEAVDVDQAESVREVDADDLADEAVDGSGESDTANAVAAADVVEAADVADTAESAADVDEAGLS